MITYVIDNGLRYSSKALYFVEAPSDFGKWFNGVLLPWLRRNSMRGDSLSIIGTSHSITWINGQTTMPYHVFLEDDSVIDQYNYDESPWERRPLYGRRGE